LHFFSSIFWHNGVQLGLEFPPKLQLDSPVCLLHVASLYYYYFYFYFEKKIDFWGITQNWVMTLVSKLKAKTLKCRRIHPKHVYTAGPMSM
jgi:hypothetical protein